MLLRTQLIRLLAAAAAMVTAPGFAAIYHVAPPPTGNDGNDGSAGAPWATLQRAADTVGAGDSVLVHAGAYGAFEVTTSGSPGSRIVFHAVAGELVEIDSDLPGRGVGINLEGASYITVEGFVVSNRAVAGIRAVLCDGVVIRGNRLQDNGRWGIFTGCCDDLVIEGNLASGSGDEHGIYVSNSGDTPTIRGNVIFDNHANGIHMNGDASIDCGGATDDDGVISGALVEGNTIYGNGVGGGSGINCDGLQDSLIRNNLIFDQHASGISLYQIDGGAPASGNRIENNTVLVADDGRWALNIQDAATGNTVRNNILWSSHSYRGAMSVCADCLTGFTSDRNAVEDRFTLDYGDSVLTLAEWQTATGEDAASLPVGDPAALFVAMAGANFHLVAGSAALDSGEVVGDLAADLESVGRPRGATFDIGAFEGGEGLFSDGFEGGAAVRWSVAPPPW